MKTLKAGFLLLVVVALLAAVKPLTASPALELAKQLNQAFIEVADKVSPSVVVINVIDKPVVPALDDEDGSPWSAIPREFRRSFRQQFEEQHKPEKTRGQGSGVIIRADGYILTNRHVVEDAEKIEVRLQDGRRFPAQVRGVDAQSDVAVIKIDAKGLPAAALADSSKTRVGEFAIAIGAPFALDYSVTFGHVSAKGRSGVVYDPSMDQDFIQTDANINPGNSGGPLVNINGEVIGINTLIRGLQTGIGFAIPINLAREVADKLIADGKFTRAWLGIGISSLAEDLEFQELVQGVREGVVVKSIEPNGPAAKSDLKPTDVITAVDGVSVSTAQQLKNEVRRKQIGQPVTLDVVRRGQSIKIKVKTDTWQNESTPEVQPIIAQSEDASALGLTVQTLTHELAAQFGADMTRGVIITTVEQGSMADKRGLRPGDIITEVGQKPVANPREFRAAIKDADLKRGVILNLISGKTSRFAILKDGDE